MLQNDQKAKKIYFPIAKFRYYVNQKKGLRASFNAVMREFTLLRVSLLREATAINHYKMDPFILLLYFRKE